MLMQPLHLRVFTFVITAILLAFSGWANADPPSRVGRLGYVTGVVSFSPAGESDWVRASLNRPLTTGDRLWTNAGARTEIQVGGAMIRMNAGTSVSILNLDNRIVQLQLTQGTLNVRVRRLGPNQVFEVDTPNLAFTLRKPGEYRITVDPDGNATTIFVRKGQGEAYGEGAAYVLDSRQPYRFTGAGLREYRYVDAPRFDEFDRWSSERDRRYDNAGSARYVSQDVVGYQDLDANGTWRVDVTYGNVWIPNRVASGWAPYRDGHWAWIDPWGWTWVDDAPWGFAVSHYGRWTNLRGTWGWVPGPVRTQAYYAPALVAFVGGNNFQLAISSGSVDGVAWFPLGPREVYQPSYPVSRSYFENVNRSNTVINNTVINNYYSNSNVTPVAYANRDVLGAVIAVPTTAFVQSQPVSRAAVRVTREMVASAPVLVVAPVAPTERSVRGAAGPGDKPPARVFERPVVARTAPAAAQVGFAAQQQQLTAKPGKPLDDAARKELKPAAAVPAPMVKVVAPTQAAVPTQRPPPAAADARPGDARGKSEQRGNSGQRVQPAAPPQRAEPPQVAPSQAAPAAQPAEPRGKSEQRGNSGQRVQPAAPPQRAAPSEVAPSQAAPAAQPAEPRGKSEQRGNSGQRVQPVAPPQRAAPPEVAPPQAAPAAQPAEAASRRPARPERDTATRQVEPRAAAVTPKPQQQQPQPVPNVEQRGQKPKPGVGKRSDKDVESDEQNLEEEKRKQKR
ncbi:MAG: hypothetical protein Q7K57_24105 [Burkholderiaceae bacterium]|nr:hypothetical protein [Burkholderiaceae bacterium]